MRILSNLAVGAGTVQALHFAKYARRHQVLSHYSVWNPKTAVDEEVEGKKWEVTESQDCRCPEGQFWYAIPDATIETGGCIPKFGLGQECGWFPTDVQARVCQSGLACTPVADEIKRGKKYDDVHNFGAPAQCRPGSDGDGANAAAADGDKCIKVISVSGDSEVCWKIAIEKQSCDGHAGAKVEAKASSTATATAVVESPPVTVTGESGGVKATVTVPGEKKEIKEEVKVEAKAVASADATAKATGESGDIQKCATAEEALTQMGLAGGPLTAKQGERAKKMAGKLARKKAMDAALEKAGDEACKDAKEVAEKMAQEEALDMAKDIAKEQAEEKAQAAADAAAEGASNVEAEKQLSPEKFEEAKATADAAAAKAAEEAQKLQGEQAATSAASQEQTEATPAAAATASGDAPPSPAAPPAQPPAPGVKQTEGDVAATQP